jgi:hypothetical protein
MTIPDIMRELGYTGSSEDLPESDRRLVLWVMAARNQK